jgi:hypothetical protein
MEKIQQRGGGLDIVKFSRSERTPALVNVKSEDERPPDTSLLDLRPGQDPGVFIHSPDLVYYNFPSRGIRNGAHKTRQIRSNARFSENANPQIRPTNKTARHCTMGTRSGL